MKSKQLLSYLREFWYDESYIGPDYTTPNPDFRVADYIQDVPMLDNDQPDGLAPYDYDWWGEGTQNGHILENRIDISGGNDNVSYFCLTLIPTKKDL